jgi:hypothetical protein
MISQAALASCAKKGKRTRLLEIVGEAVRSWESEFKLSLNDYEWGVRDNRSTSASSRAFRRWQNFPE